MKKIAFIMDSLCFGGSETQTVDLVNELEARGYWIMVFSLDPVDTLKDRINPSVEVNILKKKRYLDIGSLRKMISKLKEFEPEAIFLVNTYSMMYGYLAGFFLARKPARIVVQHSTFLENRLEKAKNLYYKRIMNTMDRIVFVSCRQRDHWVSRYRIKPEKSIVIHNGIDIEKYENHRVDKATVLDRLGCPPTDILIGIVARLTPEKRHEDLIEAMVLLLGDGYQVRLLIIGDGDRRGFIEEVIRSSGINDRVVITGFVEDVRDYLACIDISVLASSTEALSMAVIESMAMSKPIVLTDVGGARELVGSFKNGIVYEPGNVEELVRALKYIIDHRLFGTMGEKSLSRVKSSFGKDKMVQAYIDLLGDRNEEAVYDVKGLQDSQLTN